MGSKRITLYLCILAVSFLTMGAQSVPRLNIPPCPTSTQRVFYPDAQKPNWTGCKDAKGLYQGLIIQFSTLTEVLRIAYVTDSFRDGKEIRFGSSGTMEERNYKNGHLQGDSYIYKTDAVLGRIMPKPMTPEEWKHLQNDPQNLAPDSSLLKVWLKQEPSSTLTFQNGRLSRMQFEKKDYRFKVTPDGRMISENHPEMKGQYFIDSEPLWVLNADDLKKALLPGFGSCKKYAGPIGRYERYFDHLLFQREKSEKTHYEKLKEMRDRFIRFCVPDDIRDHLGTLECPPHLPSTEVVHFCELPISDQLHLPYLPKYFKNEFTREMLPEDYVSALQRAGLTKLMSDFENKTDVLKLNADTVVEIKKGPKGVVFKNYSSKDAPKKGASGEGGKDWADWHILPGY